MAISFIAATSAESNSVTIPSHQKGDLIVIVAANNPAITAITPPPGWYRPMHPNPSGVTGVGYLGLWFKVANSSNELSGTWTNATLISALVYRRSGGGLAQVLATLTVVSGTNQNFNYSAIPEDQCSSVSNRWVMRYFLAAENDYAPNAPSGHVLRADQKSTSDGMIAVFDTDGAVADGSISASSITDTSGTAAPKILRTAEIVPFEYVFASGGFTGIRGTTRTLGT